MGMICYRGTNSARVQNNTRTAKFTRETKDTYIFHKQNNCMSCFSHLQSAILLIQHAVTVEMYPFEAVLV